MAITANDVIEITGAVGCSNEIDPFITTAECQIEKCTGTFSEKCLVAATANLAAHYYVSSPVGRKFADIKRRELKEAFSVTYAKGENTGTGVMSTSFGQTANALMDGCLAELDKRPAAFISIGARC